MIEILTYSLLAAVLLGLVAIIYYGRLVHEFAVSQTKGNYTTTIHSVVYRENRVDAIDFKSVKSISRMELVRQSTRHDDVYRYLKRSLTHELASQIMDNAKAVVVKDYDNGRFYKAVLRARVWLPSPELFLGRGEEIDKEKTIMINS